MVKQMKTSRYATFLLLVAGALPIADHACAQEREDGRTPESEVRDLRLAGFLEWVLPFVGHVYAGDAAAGVRPNLVFGGTLAVAIIARREDLRNGTQKWRPLYVVGGLTAVACRIWAIGSAVGTAKRTNELLENRSATRNPGIELSVTPAGRIAMGVVVRF